MGGAADLDTLKEFIALRWPDREKTDDESISEIVGEVRAEGFNTIGALDKALKGIDEAVGRYEQINTPQSEYTGESTRYADVGVVRVCLGLLNKSYPGSHEKEKRALKEARLLLKKNEGAVI